MGFKANEHEGRGGWEPKDLAAAAVAGHDGAESSLLAFELDDIHAGVDHELRIGPHSLRQNGRGRQARAGENPYPVGELGQLQPFFQRRVAAPDDDDLLGPR